MWSPMTEPGIATIFVDDLAHDPVSKDERSGDHGTRDPLPHIHGFLPNPVVASHRVVEHLE